MRNAIQRPVRSWLVPLAMLLALGCQSKRYRMGFDLPVGQETELLVLGDPLRILVDNEGPGLLLVEFDSPEDASDERVQLARGTVTRSMPGPVRLRCTATGDQGTSVEVRAWGATGLSLDQTP